MILQLSSRPFTNFYSCITHKSYYKKSGKWTMVFHFFIIVGISVYKGQSVYVDSLLVLVLSPPQRLLFVNTRERNGSGSAGGRKWERGERFPYALSFFLFPASARRGYIFPKARLQEASAEERGVSVSQVSILSRSNLFTLSRIRKPYRYLIKILQLEQVVFELVMRLAPPR